MAKSSAAKPGKGSKTSYYQYLAMVEWLEKEPGKNFNLITGNATSTLPGVVAGTKLKKKDAYEQLALFVNQRCSTGWDLKNAEARYVSYLAKYKEVSRALANPGEAKYCLSQVELDDGLTLESKLESDCAFFRRMEALFGSKQNVMPTHILQVVSALPTDILVINNRSSDIEENNSSSDSEDEPVLPSLVLPAAAPLRTPTAAIAVVGAMSGGSGSGSRAWATTNKRNASVSTPLIGADLRALCAESVHDAAMDSDNKVSLHKKQKKDFTSVYADSRVMEITLEKEKFEWMRSNYDVEQRAKEKAAAAEIELKERGLAEETKRAEMGLTEETKRALMIECLKQGKTMEETKAYINFMLFN